VIPLLLDPDVSVAVVTAWRRWAERFPQASAAWGQIGAVEEDFD
jgi:hypothetical protein